MPKTKTLDDALDSSFSLSFALQTSILTNQHDQTGSSQRTVDNTQPIQTERPSARRTPRGERTAHFDKHPIPTER